MSSVGGRGHGSCLSPEGQAKASADARLVQAGASRATGSRAERSQQGRICRKAGKSKKSFSRKEAEATFKSLVKTHEKYGWVTPPVSDG
ncbi:3110006e14rik protein [Lynx pardinus]|uniref:3110006e14rik protein n=1 Tax=Lynx pardinus TaxID=191816 RepID=A0A485NPB5_LYNPA|nr:3110006e14rik protein [Lynx pardinus]